MKNYIVNAVVALLLIIGVGVVVPKTQPAPQQSDSVGSVRIVADSFPKGINLGTEFESQEILNLPVGTNIAEWVNRTGKAVVVNYVDVTTNATASSSYAFWLYSTTTAASTFYNFGVNPTTGAGTVAIIDGHVLATSTVATTTSSLQTSGMRTTRIPANGRLVLLLKQQFSTPCGPTFICDTSTSTNRAFTARGVVKYHSVP